MDRKEAIQVLQTALTSPFIYGGYAEAIRMAIEALSANCTTEKPNDAVEQKNDVVVEPTDLISRADAMGAVQDHFNADGFKGYDDGQKMMDRITSLPSADRPSGEWIMHIDDLYPEESTQECSNCHEHETIKINNDNYCPNCGAKMGSDTK